MGLDIRAYRGLQLAPAGQLSDDSSLYLGRPLPTPIRLSPVARMVFTPRWPIPAVKIASHSRPAHTCTTVSGAISLPRWRVLAAPKVRTNPEKEGLPFVELINFSDCEGVIGPEVAAKLAKDFADYEFSASAFAAIQG